MPDKSSREHWLVCAEDVHRVSVISIGAWPSTRSASSLGLGRSPKPGRAEDDEGTIRSDLLCGIDREWFRHVDADFSSGPLYRSKHRRKELSEGVRPAVGGERARSSNVRPHLPLVVDVVGRSGVRALLNAPDEWGISSRDSDLT